MPKFKEDKSKTSSGIICSGGDIKANDLDEVSWRDLDKDYDNMEKDTPAIASSYNLLVYPAEAAQLKFDPGKSNSDKAKEAAEYMAWCFENLRSEKAETGGYNSLVKHKLRAPLKGVSFHEKIKRLGDEYKVLRNGKYKKITTNRVIEYSPFQNYTIEKFHYKDNKFIGIQHERQDDNGGVSIVDIVEGQNGIKNIWDVLSVYSWRSLYKDIRGQSIIRPARLYWTCLKKVIIGKTINIQAGRGLIGIKVKTNITPEIEKKIKRMGESLNALNGNNYYYYEDSNLDVIVNDLKGQGEVQAFIDFLYKQILMTLLTQFISIGMGQTGTYAAGETQKSPYEIALNALMEDLLREMQFETDYMMNIGYLSDLSIEDRPIARFSAVTQADMLKVSNIILNFRNAGINFSNEEMADIKAQLPFLAERKINVNTKTETPENEDEEILPETNQQQIQMKADKKDRALKPHILEFESAIFQADNATNHFIDMDIRAGEIVNGVLSKIISDVKGQVKAGRRVDVRYGAELKSKLLKLWEESYTRGEGDVNTELTKVKELKSLQLAISKSDKTKQNKTLSILVDALMQNITSQVNYDMGSIPNKPGIIDNYFNSLAEKFIGGVRDLVNETSSGYTEGRNDTLDMNTDNNSIFLYSGKLDKNMCNDCSGVDGLTFTKKEINDSGSLSLTGKSVNLDCRGLLRPKGHCRCQWIFYGGGNE